MKKLKKSVFTLIILGITTNLTAQNNLGVNQTNPTAKTHITNTENQNSLQIDDEANDTTPFVVDSLGNVGVQTETPQADLDVNGGVKADSIQLTNGATAGAVLTSDVNGNASWQPVLPAGVIMPFGGVVGVSPNGWLICDGTAVSRTTYANLFAMIGTNYGAGDGTTTFNLPDFRGQFLRGTDNGVGNDPDAATRTASNIGGNAGDAVGSLQGDEIISHNHTEKYRLAVSHVYEWSSNQSFNISGGLTTTNTGSTGGSETRPKNVNVNFIIKY